EAEYSLDRPLLSLMFEGPDEELSLTQNSQLAIYITSVALYRSLIKTVPHFQPTAYAGLSLGEYSALTASGALSFDTGLKLVAKRAALMEKATTEKEGAMAVIIGLNRDEVHHFLLDQKSTHVWIANINSPTQIVISGEKMAIQKILPLFKEAGAKRAMLLKVSGAFHSPYMASAQKGLHSILKTTPFATPSAPIVMNHTGEPTDGQRAGIQKALYEQITSPVLWLNSLNWLSQRATQYIEIGAGITLASINKWGNIPTLPCQCHQDIIAIKHLTEDS
ncbi:MAG: ACP S-malonyltransferase, partial [Chlamydiota bacterium]|nr:ACP S-malonyltransferase [Chlamydiota bacterium]